MTGHGEFDDDRDSEETWAGDVLALEDYLIDPDLLDQIVPLDGRWPESRLLDQTAVFYLRDRTRLQPLLFDRATADWLLDELHTDLPDWHAAAAWHEEATSGSLTRAALTTLGIRPVRYLDPQAWLESTVLFRYLRDL